MLDRLNGINVSHMGENMEDKPVGINKIEQTPRFVRHISTGGRNKLHIKRTETCGDDSWNLE